MFHDTTSLLISHLPERLQTDALSDVGLHKIETQFAGLALVPVLAFYASIIAGVSS